MHWIETSIWLALAILFYTFFGYGILLFVCVSIKNMAVNKTPVPDGYEPAVTLIVPCYNEAAIMEYKIHNCLELDYPATKLFIVFITDGSTDDFEAVLQKYPRIQLLHQPVRSGKTAAENRAMQYVNTPVVIFSDANTLLNKQSLRKLVRHFVNDKTGCVSGEKRIIASRADSASAAGEGMYWKYESMLKKMDSDLNSAVGAVGELIALRTNLYKPLPNDTLLDDFMQSMLIAAEGYTIVYEPEAIATETASINVAEELKRKIRIATGNWQAMKRLSGTLRFSKTPLLFFQYFSHRILRRAIAPFLLILVFFLNILPAASGQLFFEWLFFLQLLFYSTALAGYFMRNQKIYFKPFFIPCYFCLMHYAVLAGLYNYLFNEQKGIWDKVERK